MSATEGHKEEDGPGVKIKIAPVFSDYVFRWDKIKINTNNCWSLRGCRPDDYYEVLDRTHTEHWIYRFHDPSTVKTLTLDSEDLDWMRKAQQIGSLTRDFSQLYADELEETLLKYAEMLGNGGGASLREGGSGGGAGSGGPWLRIRESDPQDLPGLPQEGWFVRTPRVSLKNGKYGVGPYRSLEFLIRSLVSSNPGHLCFNDEDRELTLYFIPFQPELDVMKEFRVFVYQGQITAISQQALYTRNPWLTKLHNGASRAGTRSRGEAGDPLERLIRERILAPYETEVRPKMEGYLDSYTMDFALVGPELRPYFIEPNSWGAQYSAGSALFGWEQDHNLLHDPKTVEFRYTIANYDK